MRTVPANTLAALQSAAVDGVEIRDYVTIRCWDLAGEPVERGFWAGLDTVAQDVIDPDSGAPESRVFEGSGTLLDIGRIAATADLSIRRVDIALSPLKPSVAGLVVGHRLRGAEVQIHRGILSPATRRLVDDPLCAFAGFIDGAPDPRPKPGSSEARVTIRAVSDTRRLTRANPARFSDAQVRSRDPDDAFGAYAGVVGQWEIVVGANK